MAYKKPQDPLTNNGFGIYPLTTADQVILSDGSRLEKNGVVDLVTLPTTEETPGNAPTINAGTFGGMTVTQFVEMIYPVGSIYMSANATSPASLFGGTWESISGRFLLGADATYAAGNTGGEAEHTLTADEMPEHFHILPYKVGWGNQNGIASWQAMFVDGTITDSGADGYTGKWHSYQTQHNGGSKPHNNMPPYLAVYMWQRTA